MFERCRLLAIIDNSNWMMYACHYRPPPWSVSQSIFLDRSIILHLRLMMVLMIICYFYAFMLFSADIISLLCSLKAFELLLSIKAGLNYANARKSHHFLQVQQLLSHQIWYICQNCLSNYISFFLYLIVHGIIYK